MNPILAVNIFWSISVFHGWSPNYIIYSLYGPSPIDYIYINFMETKIDNDVG